MAIIKMNENDKKKLDEDIKKIINERRSLKEIVDKITISKVTEIVMNIYSNKEIEKYFMNYIEENFTDERIKISNRIFYISIFGKDAGNIKWIQRHKEYEKLTYLAVDNSYKIQKEKFIKENRKFMNLDKDEWCLYFLKGTALNSRTFSFSLINSPSLRKEVKMLFKYKLWNEDNFRSDRGIALITTGLNIIMDKYKNIMHFKDIDISHVNYLCTILESDEIKSQFDKKLSVSSIRKCTQGLGGVVNYLIELDGYKNKPIHNYFQDITYNNTSSMEKNTEIIPGEVINQIHMYVDELYNDYRLLYEILEKTGLRIKEVTHLEKDCLKPSGEKDYYILEYTPYKILVKLRKAGLSEKGHIAINRDLAERILKRIEEKKELMELGETQYFFINPYNEKGKRTAMLQESEFVAAINRIIKKHDIVDINNDLWHFTSRQTRKTLAVNLAENGATQQEIANQFGHLDTRTTEKYYAEVRQKKLAELNSKFFKNKFKVLLGEENLKYYTEEERRTLYVDFAMEFRDVEFGKCTKHISEGSCGNRSGTTSCATCSKLCTGEKYLSKWIELRDSQIRIVQGLTKIYEKEEISKEEYMNFIEFKKENTLLLKYETVINKIKEDSDNVE